MPVTISARDLSDMLTATIPYASVDKTLPTINVVRFESEKDHLITVATDRYSMGVSRKEAHVQVKSPVEFNLPLARAKELVRMLKWSTTTDVTITLIGEKLSFDMGEVSFAAKQDVVPHGTNEFPKWRALLAQIVKEPASNDGAHHMAFNPMFLAKLAKVPRAQHHPVRFYFPGSNRLSAAAISDWFTALHMPLRHDSDTPDRSDDPIAHVRTLAGKQKGGKK